MDLGLVSSSSGSPCTFSVIIFPMFFWLEKLSGHVAIAAWLPPCPTVGVSLSIMLLGDVGAVEIDLLAAKWEWCLRVIREEIDFSLAK